MNWASFRKSRAFKILIAVAVLLVIIHLTLPFAIRKYVQHTLDKIEGYKSSIGIVYLNLLRGAYSVRDVKFEKITGEVPVPFFEARIVDFSIEWKALFDGSIVGEVYLKDPKLNFVKGPTAEESQTEVDESWMDRVKELFPLKLNRVETEHGEIHFRDFHRTPEVDMVVTNVHLLAENLTNSRNLSEDLMAKIQITGDVVEQGALWVDLDVDPLSELPNFVLKAEIKDVDLTAWNDFLQAYGNFDVSKGEFSVYTEMTVKDGVVEGYIKPLLKDVAVAPLKKLNENPLKAVWELIVAGVAELLTNQPKDQIATKIPLHGELNNPSVGIIGTIGTLLRNAFIQALFPGLESASKEGEE